MSPGVTKKVSRTFMVKIWFFSFRYWKSFSYPPRILQYAVNWAGTLWPKAMQFLDALASGVSGNDFWTFGNGNGNGSAHSQTLGTGTGMKNCIPNFWEREREWKFHSQFLGTGTGMEIPFPNFGNGNETLSFPGITGNGNGIVELSENFLNTTFHCNLPQMWWIPQQICSNIV